MKLIKNACEIRVDRGKHYLYFKGEKLPYQISSVVSDGLEGNAVATVELMVNLVDSNVNDNPIGVLKEECIKIKNKVFSENLL